MTAPTPLRRYDDALAAALDELAIPAFLIDKAGTVRWLNRAAAALVGEVLGRRCTVFVAPEDLHAAREIFARKLLGDLGAPPFTLRLLDLERRRVVVEFSCVAVREQHAVVGVFAIGRPLQTVETAATGDEPALTPRQHEIVRLLADGNSTEAMAATLRLSAETVRNHVRALLAALGAHSRLEAVALARRHGLLD